MFYYFNINLIFDFSAIVFTRYEKFIFASLSVTDCDSTDFVAVRWLCLASEARAP
jgi:hypothetical protein